VIVDRDMDPVPAGPFLFGPDRPPDEVIATACGHPGELFGIEMDQLARAIAFIADDRWSGLQPIEAGEVVAAQDRVRGRRSEAGLPGQNMGTDAQLPASGAERGDNGRSVPDRRLTGRTRAIGELTGLRSLPPFRAGLPTDPGGACCPTNRPASTDPLGQEPATPRGQSSVRMRH
jgi:hypothetical protein